MGVIITSETELWLCIIGLLILKVILILPLVFTGVNPFFEFLNRVLQNIVEDRENENRTKLHLVHSRIKRRVR
jgi:hypothetical protein